MSGSVTWYKTAVSRETLRTLTRKSNLKGLLQTVGYLGTLALSGVSAALSIGNTSVFVSILLFMVHGVVWSFMLNGFHELSHNTVFRSRWLNKLFLRVFSFLSWNNYVFFQASHREHHLHTLHPPEDLEVLLPIKLTVSDFLLRAIINPIGFVETVIGTVRLSLGIVRGDLPTGFGAFRGEWLARLFPPDNTVERRRLVNWARITLLGHSLLTVVSLLLGFWYIPVLITAAPFYGSWLLYFLNHTQHIGLKDNVDDFRLNSRTIILGPVLRFLYWHMNFHIEHHMYAAVPCYNLGRLHEAIKHDLPTPTRGLIQTWIKIFQILKKQKSDPGYQYNALEPNLP